MTSCDNPRAKERRLWARKKSFVRIALGQCVLMLGTSVSHLFLFPVATVAHSTQK